jgi:drug/metabolite transporter (DMT)-like permease
MRNIGEIQLLGGVVLFGISFVFQRVVAVKTNTDGGLQPLTFNALRYLWSSVLLLAAFPLYKSIDSKGWSPLSNDLGGKKGMLSQCLGEVNSPRYHAWYYGVICGITTFFASCMQQIGLIHSSVAKCAFITSLYVIVVPIFESFLPGGHMSLSTWTAAAVSILGTYFVSGLAEHNSEGDHSSQRTALISELILFLGTIFWTLCIIFMDRGCRHANCVLLTLIEFVVCALMSLAAAAIWEADQLVYPYTSIGNNIEMILCVGITETAAFVLCSMGQTTVESSRAALLMSFESLAGALAGFLFLNEMLTLLELFGCVLMSVSFFISAEEWTIDDLALLLARWHVYEGSLGAAEGEAELSRLNKAVEDGRSEDRPLIAGDIDGDDDA